MLNVKSQDLDPIQRISGSEAYANLTGSARYPSPDRDPQRYIPLPTIEHSAKFRIKHDAKIFTIGSCFARNVERALVNLGFDVLSSFVEGVSPDQNITNKYTPPSIRQDLELVLLDGITNSSLRRTFYSLPSGGFVNLAFGGSGSLNGLTANELQDLSKRYYETFSQVVEADVIVLTLGLVEVWFDLKMKQYLNIAPTKRMVAIEPDRFELQVLSCSDILRELDLIYRLIREKCKSTAHLLITVSPVPLHATFRGQDCLQANMYSKSALRSAVDHFCAKNPEVAYFPSYEMVVLSSPERAWIDKDFRHVRPELVERIMSQVLGNYVERALPPTKLELRALISDCQHEHVINKVEKYLTDGGELSRVAKYVLFYYGIALDAVGRHSEAIQMLESVVVSLPLHQPANRALIAAKRKMQLSRK